MIGSAEVAAGELAGPHAGDKGDRQGSHQHARRCYAGEVPTERPCDERTSRARSERRESRAEAERNHVRRVREGEPGGGPRGDHLESPKWSKLDRYCIGTPSGPRTTSLVSPAWMVPMRERGSFNSTDSAAMASRLRESAVKTSS